MQTRTCSTHPRERTGAPAYLLIAVAYPLVWMLAATGGSSERLAQYLEDDAYYYALVAQRLAAGDGSTFPGANSTNGYQPLWQALLALLALIAHGNAFLWLVVGLQALLFVSLIVLFWMLCRQLDAVTEGAWATAYCASVSLAFGVLVFAGMETALVLFASLLLVWLLVNSPLYGPESSGRDFKYWVAVGLAALVLALSRLDAVALPLCFGLVTLFKHRRSRERKQMLYICGITLALGAAVYAAVNFALFETPVPVSGQAKAIGGGTIFTQLTLNYLQIGLFLGLQATIVSLAALFLLRKARVRSVFVFSESRDSAMSDILLAIVLAQILQLVYYGATTTWSWWEWYYYYIPIQLLLGGVTVMRVITRSRLGSAIRRPVLGYCAVLVPLLVVLFAVSASQPVGTTWRTAIPDVARWLRAHTSTDDVLAIGDRAGYLTWLTGRPTLQLEGLVGDAAFLDDIRLQRIADRMSAEHVSYYIRGDGPEKSERRQPVADKPGCWSLMEPSYGRGPKSKIKVCDSDLVYSTSQDDGSRWEIWRFRPQLQ